VFVAWIAAGRSGSKISVLAAPQLRTVAERVVPSAAAATLCGMVTFR